MPDRQPVADSNAGWRSVWTERRARFWLVACTVAVWLPLLGMPLRGWLDFSAFYTGGHLAFSPGLVQLGPSIEFQAARDLPPTPWVYPPSLALLYVPLALLPYTVAAALHVVIMAGLLVSAAALGARELGIQPRLAVLGAVAWAPSAAGVVSGQNTSLALLLVVCAAAALVRGRSLLAGFLVGALAYKPQLAPPVGGTLLLRGLWQAAAVASAAVGLHYVLGVVATGGNVWWPSDWIETLSRYTTPDFEQNGWQAISLPSFGHRLEVITNIPGPTVLGYVAGAGFVVASLRQLRQWPVLDAIALACAVGLVVSPHAWVYDATLLLPALGVLAVRSAHRGWPWRDRWLFAGAFIAAATWPVGGFIGVTAVLGVTLVVPVAMLRSEPVPAAQTRTVAQ